MEELKKDVESVKILTSQKSFLESVNDMNLLRKKSVPVNDLDDSFSSQYWPDVHRLRNLSILIWDWNEKSVKHVIIKFSTEVFLMLQEIFFQSPKLHKLFS